MKAKSSSSLGDTKSQTSSEAAFDLIGEAKHVLIVGGAASSLPQLLESHGCELTFVLSSAVHSDEARVYSSHVEVADLGDVSLSDLLPNREFDAIVFDAGEATLSIASRVLNDARRVLSEGGRIVGLLPNATHGAIRLALLKGLLAGDSFDNAIAPELTRFTLEGAYRLFLQAGYDVETVTSVTHPVFEPSDLLPALDRSQFSAASVREVEADPAALTIQFVVSALPVTDANGNPRPELQQVLAEARERAIAQNAKVLPFAPHRDEAPLSAELEGTRRQAASNAAAASRARLEIVSLQSRLDELNARQGDMVARIHELENTLQDTVAGSASELDARTHDMAARIGELEDRLSASVAESAKARARADSACARLERRNAYIAQLAAVQDATQTMLSQARAAAAILEAQVGQAKAASENQSVAIEKLHSELANAKDSARTLTETLSSRSRIIAKLETVRQALQAQLDRATEALDERSQRANALELSEGAARLELWVVRAELESRIVTLKERARIMVEEERAHCASLEEALLHANTEIAAVAAEKDALQQTIERSAEDAVALRSELLTLQESQESARAQHERELAEVHRSLDETRSELAAVKAANAEIPILNVRAIKSEKQLEMVESQLLEMTKRARALEDNLLAAVSRELQLQRDVAEVGEQARRAESDFESAARRAEQTEHELEQAARHSAHQKVQLAEATERIARRDEQLEDTLQQLEDALQQLEDALQRCARLQMLEPQVHELSDQVKQLEGKLLAAAGQEEQFQYDAWRIGEQVRRLEADLEQSNRRADQLEDDLQKARHLALQQEQELLEAARRSERQEERLVDASQRTVALEAQLDEASRECARLSDQLGDTSQRCDQLKGELAQIHSSRAWKFASGFKRVLKPWDSG